MSPFEQWTHLWSSKISTDHDAWVCSGWSKFRVSCWPPACKSGPLTSFSVYRAGWRASLEGIAEPGQYNVRYKGPLCSTGHVYNFAGFMDYNCLPDVPMELANHGIMMALVPTFSRLRMFVSPLSYEFGQLWCTVPRRASATHLWIRHAALRPSGDTRSEVWSVHNHTQFLQTQLTIYINRGSHQVCR